MNWVCADFETSNSDKNISEEYTRVWLWDIFLHKEKIHYNGLDIESFFKRLFSMKSTIVYFHNLKFDGSFIMYYLLSHGFKISDMKEDMTIKPLITDRLVWYTFTVYKNRQRYVFRDSAKKIIGDLRTAAVDFGLPIRKGEIDYRLHRDEGYVPTEEEVDYIHHDTEIMSDILEYYYENGMGSITNATDALKAYKNIINEKYFNHLFPILPKSIDDFIRKSYKGGFCYLNPEHFDKDLTKVYCYDVKSMYPTVMANDELPFGIPQYYTGHYLNDEKYPLYICHIRACFDLKEGHIPSIQTKSFMTIKLNYIRSSNGQIMDLTLTSVDYERFLNDYYIYDIEFIDGFKFRSSKELFREYVEKYFNLKESSTGARKQLYKIFLNSLYGKFAMNPEKAKAIPKWTDKKLAFDKTDFIEEESIYTAVASFITANARRRLLNGIYANLENFIYCDTDSMQLLAPAKGVDLGNKLGQWNIENGEYEDGDLTKPKTFITAGRYLGQKCYMLVGFNPKKDKAIELKKIAGAPLSVKKSITLDNFRINFTSDKDAYPKFRVKQVKGGAVLVPTEFTIHDRR